MCGYAVDWMKACRRSKWRLTRGSDRTRDGFYYFSPDATPFFPGWHNLGARDWVSAERPLWSDPPLGEYSGPTKWYRGDPPAVLPLPVLVGEFDCVKNGETPGKAIQTHKSARCTDMLPRACYLDAEILAQKTKADNCLWAFVCLLTIADAYGSTTAAGDRMRSYFGLDATIVPFEFAGALSPAGIIIIVNEVCIVCITGTTILEQGVAQALAFGFGPQFFGDYDASPVYEAAASLVLTQMAAVAGVAACTRFVCTGHSYGGATAIVLAAKLKLVDANRQVEIITFGAPKAGGRLLRAVTRPLKQLHYVHELDPVPYLPPNGVDFFHVISLITAGLRGEWGLYVRPAYVFQITNAGTLDLQEAEDIPNDAVTAIALAINAHADVPSFNSHNANTYAMALAKACSCVAPPVNNYRVTVTRAILHAGVLHLPDPFVTDCNDFADPGLTWTNPADQELVQILTFDDGPDAGTYVEIIFSDIPSGETGSGFFKLPVDWWLGCTLLNPPAGIITGQPFLSIDSIRIEPHEIV